MVNGPERRTLLDFTLDPDELPSLPEPSGSDRANAAQDFARQSGVSPEILSQLDQPNRAEIEEARQKNALYKRALNSGNKWGWGMGKIYIGGATGVSIPFINPVKTAWSGLKAWQRNVVDPMYGVAVGRSAVTAQSLGLTREGAIFDGTRVDSVANDYRDALSATGTSWNIFDKEQYKAFGDYSRNRESLFSGEKFWGTLLIDPTTYLGFGLFGKAPVIGKVLGPIESGYVEAVNVPFKYMGKLFGKIPKTRGQTASQMIGHAYGRITSAVVAVTDGAVNFAQANAGVTSFRASMAKILQPARDPKTLTKAEMELKSVVYARPVKAPDQYEEFVTAVKGDLSLLSWESKGTHQLLIGLQDLLDMHLMGRLHIDEVVDAFIVRVNGKNVAETRKALAEKIEADTATKVRQIDHEMATTTPQSFRSKYSVQEGEIYTLNTALGFDLWKRRQGAMGAFIGQLDNTQRIFYQQGLRKWVLRPIGTLTLSFLGFPLQEVGESVLRQATGRSTMGFSNRREFERTFDSVLDIMPASIARGDYSLYASRGALTTSDDAASLKSLLKGPARPLADFLSRHGNKLKYLNPIEIVNLTGRISAASRRHYIYSRTYQKDVQLLQRFDENLMDLITALPISRLPLVPGSTQIWDRLHREMVIRVANSGGDAASIRAVLGDSFDLADLNERDFRRVAEEFAASNDYLGPEFSQKIDDFIESGGTTQEFDLFISGLTDDAFKRFVEGGEGFEIGMDLAMRALKRVRHGLPDELQISQAASTAVNPGHALPRLSLNLRKASPRYREGRGPNLIPQFDSDIDKALYQVTSKKRSLRHEQYVNFLETAGISSVDHAALGAHVRRRIKARYQEVKGELVDGQGFKITATRRRDVVPTDDLSDAPLGGRAHGAYDLGPSRLDEDYVGLGPESPVDATDIHAILAQSDRALNDLAKRIEDINATYIKAGERFSPKDKELNFQAGYAEVKAILDRVTDRLPMWSDEIKLAERAGGFTGYENLFKEKLDDLIATWQRNDEIVNALLRKYPLQRGRRDPKFYTEYRAEREKLFGQEGYTGRSQARYAESDRLYKERDRVLGRPEAESKPKVKKKNFKNKVLTIEDIAYIVGRQSNNVTQALIAANFRNREGFEAFVLNKAREYGHKGVRADRVGEVYGKVLSSLGFDAAYHTAFDATKRNIDEMSDALKAAFKSPRFNDTHREAAEEWVESIAQYVEKMPSGERQILKLEGRKNVESTIEEHNTTYVNYDGSNAADDLTQGLFPYITYETRRIQWMLQRGLDHPAIFTTVGPEGRYWDATDNGYIHTPWDSWDLNIFGGTMLNTPRRLFASEYPAEHQKGVRGSISKAQLQLDKVGIYLGPAATGAMELWDKLTTGHGDVGEAAPPPLTSGLAALESLPLGPISNIARDMRLQMFDDRFRDRTISHILIDRGFDLRELDIDTMTPVGENLRLTQEDINDASRESARIEMISEAMGNVRHRGDAERKYREAREKLWGELIGIPYTEARQLMAEGTRMSDLIQLSPAALSLFSLIDHSDQFGAARIPLLPEGLRDVAQQRWEFYGALNARRETFLEEQMKDDARWERGPAELDPILWAANRQGRIDQKANAGNILRGITVAPDGTEEKTDTSAPYANIPFEYDEWVEMQNEYGLDITAQRHPIQEELDLYYDIRPRATVDSDGQIDWEDFIDRQIEHEEKVKASPELGKAFMEALDDSYSPVEQAMRQFSREIARDYLQIADTIRDELDIKGLLKEIEDAQRSDQDEAAELRKLPIYRAYNKRVREAKENMRLSDPILDYGLNIFGMLSQTTQKFLSPDAKRWYEDDEKRPMLYRLGL